MASVNTTHNFACTAEELYYIIADYENYPDFLKEIQDCKILKEVGERKLVEYKVSMIRQFTYRLWMEEDWEHKTIRWQFDSGDLFRKSEGAWVLKDQPDGSCEARYEVTAKMKMFIPGSITKKLIHVNLPEMMKAYERRLQEVSYE